MGKRLDTRLSEEDKWALERVYKKSPDWRVEIGVRFQLVLQRVMPHRMLNGHAAVNADMDLRLSEALSTSPGYGLALQTQRDLWRARELAKNAHPPCVWSRGKQRHPEPARWVNEDF